MSDAELEFGIGTIVGWDADGLMTNVRWQVASVFSLLAPERGILRVLYQERVVY